MADEHRQAYERSKTPKQRLDAIQQAEKELLNARIAPKRSLIAGTLEWQMAIARDVRAAWQVAALYGCSERHVYRMRRMYKAA